MNVEYGLPLAARGMEGLETIPVRQQPSRRTLRIRLHFLLLGLDILAIFLAFVVAGAVYPVNTNEPHWLNIAAGIIPLYVFAAFGARAYSVGVLQNVGLGVARSLRALVMAGGAVLFIAFYLKSSDTLSRAIFAIGFGGSVALLAIGRAYFSVAARSLLGGSPYTVVLISEDGAGLAHGDFSVALSGKNFDPESQDPAMYDRLANALKHADRVVVSCAPERRNAWVHALQGANVQAEVLAPELAEMAPMTIARLSGVPTLVVARGPLSFRDRILKRVFDLVATGLALLILAPLMLLVALAIRIESPGPVLFVQTRIGRANQMFRMFKFRSMRADKSDGDASRLTARDDDRVTRVGKFIRATSIDELPQLINVLRGEMSIVGPRPHALGAKADELLYWEVDQRYWHRHAAKPGLTGLAQVRGFRGATNLRIDLVNRLHADLEYLDSWSIWRDLKIILLTFGVLMHKNAF